MNTSHLLLTDINHRFIQGDQVVTILDNIDISFMQGRTYGIMGLSGSGKSTLMHIIAGIDKPNHGVVSCNGRSIDNFTPGEFSRYLNESIGFVFQSSYLIKELSVIENIMLPGCIAQRATRMVYKEAELF